MAEFQEVMKQAKRMCNSYGVHCTGCDFDSIGKRCMFRVAPIGWENGGFESVEEKVMNWAAEHPEPRYPTWTEWLRVLGVERLSDIIPADIAEKLGIKPIGGVIDEK